MSDTTAKLSSIKGKTSSSTTLSQMVASHRSTHFFGELSALPNLKTGLLKERAEIYKRK